MLVRNWMTPDVISVSPETSLLKIAKTLRDHHIRRVPVVNAENVLVGIISDRDVRDASPSKASTLDMHEMNYLLGEIKAKEIMSRKVLTVKPKDSVEKAAMLMIDKKIGGLPVVDDNMGVVGIITDEDVFRALVDITGARESGVQIGMELPNEPGVMRPIFDLLRLHEARIISVLSANTDSGRRKIFIRLSQLPPSNFTALLEDIGEKANLLYWVTDETHLPDTPST